MRQSPSCPTPCPRRSCRSAGGRLRARVAAHRALETTATSHRRPAPAVVRHTGRRCAAAGCVTHAGAAQAMGCAHPSDASLWQSCRPPSRVHGPRAARGCASCRRHPRHLPRPCHWRAQLRRRPLPARAALGCACAPRPCPRAAPSSPGPATPDRGTCGAAAPSRRPAPWSLLPTPTARLRRPRPSWRPLRSSPFCASGAARR